MNACREVMQGEFGYPSVFRVSDQEETQLMMRMYGISDTPLDTLLKLKGFKEGRKVPVARFYRRREEIRQKHSQKHSENLQALRRNESYGHSYEDLGAWKIHRSVFKGITCKTSA